MINQQIKYKKKEKNENPNWPTISQWKRWVSVSFVWKDNSFIFFNTLSVRFFFSLSTWRVCVCARYYFFWINTILHGFEIHSRFYQSTKGWIVNDSLFFLLCLLKFNFAQSLLLERASVSECAFAIARMCTLLCKRHDKYKTKKKRERTETNVKMNEIQVLIEIWYKYSVDIFYIQFLKAIVVCFTPTVCLFFAVLCCFFSYINPFECVSLGPMWSVSLHFEIQRKKTEHVVASEY